MMNFVESFKSDQGGVQQEGGGGGGNVSNHTSPMDDDESERGSQSQSIMHSSDVHLEDHSIAMCKDFVSSGGRKIGPFELTEMLFELDSKIAIEELAEFMKREIDRTPKCASVFNAKMSYILREYESIRIH